MHAARAHVCALHICPSPPLLFPPLRPPAAAEEHGQWSVGNVVPLGDDDESPFLGERCAPGACMPAFAPPLAHSHTHSRASPKSLTLLRAGELPPGTSSLSVETGLFRAPAHPYPPPPSDFLLIRSPVGWLVGWLVVGGPCVQQGAAWGACSLECAPPSPTQGTHPPTRSQAGTMSLRELTGSVLVGQELPLVKMPAPTSRDIK